jgi:membrane fusion protein (multidrug efflux system)
VNRCLGVIGILFWGLILAGCDRSTQSKAPPPLPEVATVTVAPQSVVLTTELPGRTSAYMVAEIRPQVSGLILKRLFTEGSDIKAGEVLYQIDPAPFQAALDNAAASLVTAQKNADRARAALEASLAGVAPQRGTHEQNPLKKGGGEVGL